MVKLYLSKINNKASTIGLSKEIIAKVNNFKNKQARVQRINAHLLLQWAFDTHKVKNQRTRIGKSGKPYLISGELYFNVSHTKEFVICAISDNPIGADIETIDPKLKAMTTGFLSANEQLKYKHSSHVVLTKIWASKEAIVKLLGTGLTKRLSTIELDNLYTSAKRINVITLKWKNTFIALASRCIINKPLHVITHKI